MFLAAVPSTLRHELARKGIHLASAVVPVAYVVGAPRAVVVGVLAAAGVTAASIEIARARSSRVRAVFDAAVGPLLRPHEHGRWSGATWMCVAYLLAALVFPRREAAAAMLAVALGDAAAAVVGRLASGRARARRAEGPNTRAAGRKTWAGSAACFAASTLGALLVAGLSAPAALACGAAAALAERPRWAVDDNVRIVVAAGGAAWVAQAWVVHAWSGVGG
ncbi:hypothetical protein tb265_14380 [Gemmatimonadetes bacterium T265]|nr:hypothetical protein tb265_14380 [Gemmatimonadetes bacterium T265]